VSWAVLSIALVIGGVAYMLATMQRIDRARDELAHYRLSVRFWGSLAVLGLLLGGSFAHPIYVYFDPGRAAWLTIALVSIPFSVVVFAGVRNAFTLLRAHRRRREVVGRGLVLRGRVVERSRRFFQDVMAVVIEAELPDPTPRRELQYRPRDPSHTIRHLFVECCPSDHWGRFEPGTEVELEVDPSDPGAYAVHLFADAANERAAAPA
jgi:hypothetical protein